MFEKKTFYPKGTGKGIKVFEVCEDKCDKRNAIIQKDNFGLRERTYIACRKGEWTDNPQSSMHKKFEGQTCYVHICRGTEMDFSENAKCEKRIFFDRIVFSLKKGRSLTKLTDFDKDHLYHPAKKKY